MRSTGIGFRLCHGLLGRSSRAAWRAAGLLVAVARTESGLRTDALHRNQNRERPYDIGQPPTNSGHLRVLAAHGISERDLQDPSTNLQVDAWLLADLLRRPGQGCKAVGAYTAACMRRNAADGSCCILLSDSQ